jgi:hypothetical protein
LPFDWTAILGRKEQLAGTLDADWFLHHDADEFREAPWPGMKLAEGIHWVDRLGYNCIDFRVFNFPPIDDQFSGGDPREHFRYWERAADFDQHQLKCWKNPRGPVSLIPSGGHEVGLPNRRVFPIPFLLRHYPIRGQAHGRRKVFSERRGRFLDRERARQWHIQYDGIEEENHDFLADPAKLRPFDENQVRLELMLDNAVTRHEKYLAGLATSSTEERELALENLRMENADLIRAVGDHERERSRLESDLALLEQRVAAAQKLADEQEMQLTEVVRDCEAARTRLAASERELGRAEGRAAALEARAGQLTRELEVERRKGWLASLRRLFGVRRSRNS